MSRTPPDAFWTSTPREAIRDNAKPIVLSLTPDVCKTPIGSATPPIPYSIVAYPDEAATDTYAKSVRFTGQRAMQLRSNTTCCHGDEPGTAKGVKSGTVGDICEPLNHSTTVRAEGSPLIRDGDKYYMNKRNTIGQVQWVEDTETYGGKYLQYAQLNSAVATGTMTDAAPRPMPPVEPTPPRQPTPRPTADIIDFEEWKRQRGGREWIEKEAARWLPRFLRRAGTVAAFWPDSTAPFWLDEMPFGPTQTEIWDRARQLHQDGADIDDVTEWVKAQEVRSQEQIEHEHNKAMEAATASAASQARVSAQEEEDETPQCRTLLICFMPKSPKIDMAEFRRQLALQEAGLNRMTPQQMLANRAAYLANPKGMRELSKPLQQQARDEYASSERIQQQYVDRFGPDLGPRKLQEYLDNAAAPHNPSMISGGDYNSVVDQSLPIEDRIGGFNEKSSIGSQWAKPGGTSRAQRLAEHAARQARNNCPSVQAQRDVCEDNPAIS
jgi:hypothetical protein